MKESTKENSEAWILGSIGAVKGVYKVFMEPFIKEHPEVVVLGTLAVYSMVAALHKQPTLLGESQTGSPSINQDYAPQTTNQRR